MQKRIAVIGGGIAGLTAAFYLTRNSEFEVSLFEATDRLGGILGTEYRDGYLIERSADSFIINRQLPWAEKLATDIGFDQLIEPAPEHRRALIFKDNQTLPIPEGFYLAAAGCMDQVWSSSLLSHAAKLRLAAERYVRQRTDRQDESLEEFGVRRVGREVFDRLVQPLVSGIYTADPAKLSVRAALPQLVELEDKFGSLSVGMEKRDSMARRSAGARYAMFRAPEQGMQSFVDHVAAKLSDDVIRLECPVSSLIRDREQWKLGFGDGDDKPFDSVVVAAPAHVSGSLLGNIDRSLADELKGIPFAGVAVVSVAWPRRSIGHPLDAFGIVVPEVEQQDVVAVSFASNKFARRAPQDQVLLRVFLGGALRPELLQLSDDEIQETAIDWCRKHLEIEDQPKLACVSRWSRVTPQYHVGHLDRMSRVAERLQDLPGLFLAGNSYRGIGIPQCIRSGFEAANEVVDRLQTSS